MRKTRHRRRSRRRRSRKMRGGMLGAISKLFGIGNRGKEEDPNRPKSPVTDTPPMAKPQEPVVMDDQAKSVPTEDQIGGKRRRRRRKSKKKRGGGCGCASPMTGGKRKRRRRRTHKKKRKSRRRRR